MGILTIQLRQNTAGYTDVLLKDPCKDSLAHRHTPQAPAKWQWLGGHWRHTRRDWVVCLWGKNWRDSHHFSCVKSSSCAAGKQALYFLCWVLPQCQWPNLMVRSLVSSAHSNLMTEILLHAICMNHEALSAAKPHKSQHGAASLGVPWLIEELSQVQYYWQLSLIHSMATTTCLTQAVTNGSSLCKPPGSPCLIKGSGWPGPVPETLLRRSKTKIPRGQVETKAEDDLINPTSSTPKRWSQQAQKPTGAKNALWGELWT